jgi:hypothetical protein
MKTYIYIFDHISLSLSVLELEMFQRNFVETIKTHLFSITFFEYRPVYVIMWKKIVERSRQQMTIWRIRIACWITKTTNTHSQYVTLLAFPLQKWLQERALLLRFT